MITKYGQLTAHRSIASTRAHRSFFAETLQLSSEVYKRWADEAKIRKAIRELEELDDHALKDIGLQRGAIESQVRAGRRKQR
jgi:uncharacterized protein YjiS (DUF1127 family)